jgi:hypothetical protein
MSEQIGVGRGALNLGLAFPTIIGNLSPELPLVTNYFLNNKKPFSQSKVKGFFWLVVVAAGGINHTVAHVFHFPASKFFWILQS